MYLYFLIVYKRYVAVVYKFFGFYGFAKSDLYEMAFIKPLVFLNNQKSSDALPTILWEDKL